MHRKKANETLIDMKHNRPLFRSLLLTALLGAAGCSSSQVTVTSDLTPILSRYANGSTVDSVLVQALTSDGTYQTLGYAQVDGKTATFSGKITEPVFGKIKYCLSVPGGTGSSESIFILEPGNISADEALSFRGTKRNDAVNEALEKLEQCADDPQAVRTLFDDFQSRQQDVTTAYFFAKAIPALGLERWVSLLKTTSDEVRNNPYISNLSQSVEKALAAQRAREATTPGAQYADFRGTWEGKEYSLSDFVNQGKYVLVDFWASWCGPCREEIPNIIRAYNQFKDKGFEVIGVAVSDKPKDTAKAVEDLGISYTVFNETDESASKAYGIQAIPQIILISPDGTILASDLRGEEIEKTVKDILG